MIKTISVLKINNLRPIILRFAVTAAFCTGAIAVIAVIWILQLSGDSSLSSFSHMAWLHAGRVTVTYALLSGLVVDAIRLLFDLEWRGESAAGLRSK